MTPTRKEGRGWPNYIFWGRVRTSTAALIIAFIGVWWLYETYQPAPGPTEPATQVVPPGFIPDPSYTWVPRTDVQRRTTTTTTTPTTTETTTETTSPTESTSPGASPTSPTSPTTPTTTTPAPPGVPPVPGAPSPAPTPSPAPGQGPMSTPAAPTQ
jgi:cytoskeletal protein RodZ